MLTQECIFLSSPVAPITNVAPLVIVLAVSLIKEAFEDRVRSKNLKFEKHFF